jgi:hypothetical protein
LGQVLRATQLLNRFRHQSGIFWKYWSASRNITCRIDKVLVNKLITVWNFYISIF